MIQMLLLTQVSNLFIIKLYNTYGKFAGLLYVYFFLSILPKILHEEFLS